MALDIQHEKSILINFFSSKVYFIFDSEDDVSSFLDFIGFYDTRYKSDFERKSEIKSAAWVYVNSLHTNQMEWASDESYFIKNNMTPVSYSVVKDYLKNYLKIKKDLSSLDKGFDSDWMWILLLVFLCFAGFGGCTFDKKENKKSGYC